MATRVRKHAWLAALVLCAGCVAAALLFAILAVPKGAEAKIRVGGGARFAWPKPDPFSANDVPTHLALLKSRLILDPAIKNSDLAKLKALADAEDPVAAIQAHLLLARSPEDAGKVIVLRYEGESMEENIQILRAIIASYENYLDTPDEDYLEVLIKARNSLGSEFADLEKQEADLLQGHQKGEVDLAKFEKGRERLRNEISVNRKRYEFTVDELARYSMSRDGGPSFRILQPPEAIKAKTFGERIRSFGSER